MNWLLGGLAVLIWVAAVLMYAGRDIQIARARRRQRQEQQEKEAQRRAAS